ncbi:hypothetical protein HY227_02040 [Candidatus Wolfebacteria bacterium]|nr:hypothetical protein [Candidatus Wolfebacteria bacterium]
MRLIIMIILTIVLVVVLIQAYFILKEKNSLGVESKNLDGKLESLTKENGNLRAEIEYFSHPENLVKELRSKFNYRKPDEKMKIITQ